MAKGTYIGFVDGDDYIEDNMYEILLNNCIKENADIGVCGRICEKANGQCYKLFSGKPRIMSSEEATESLLLQTTCDPASWDKLYRATLFQNTRYPHGCIHEDLSTTVQLFLLSNKIVHVGKALYHYTVRDGSICHGMFGRERLEQYKQACEGRACVEKVYPQYRKASNFFVWRNLKGLLKCSSRSQKKIDEVSLEMLKHWLICETLKDLNNPYISKSSIIGAYRDYIVSALRR